jgi:hypothetical protein
MNSWGPRQKETKEVKRRPKTNSVRSCSLSFASRCKRTSTNHTQAAGGLANVNEPTDPSPLLSLPRAPLSRRPSFPLFSSSASPSSYTVASTRGVISAAFLGPHMHARAP